MVGRRSSAKPFLPLRGAKALPVSARSFCNAPFVKLTKKHQLPPIDRIDALLRSSFLLPSFALRGFGGQVAKATVDRMADRQIFRRRLFCQDFQVVIVELAGKMG